MKVLACPGQGSQTPGFIGSWIDFERFKEAFSHLTAYSGIDLESHGLFSDADTIRDTAIAQPLIVAASIASSRELEPGSWDGVAGHSVGEVAALAIAGVLSDEDAMRLVVKRGQEMAKAAAKTATSMAAILGGDQDVVLAALEAKELFPANFNGGGQIVAAGPSESIQDLVANGIAGARVVQLQVAGAFHTPFMQEAVDALADFASTLSVQDPQIALWSNKDGRLVKSGSEALELLIGQVANPVRWDLCMSAMQEAGVSRLVELAPGGALAGLAKRGMVGTEVVALKTRENLEAAKTLLSN
jgi:[acyl-carrier-protein] S-malonyltransferase